MGGEFDARRGVRVSGRPRRSGHDALEKLHNIWSDEADHPGGLPARIGRRSALYADLPHRRRATRWRSPDNELPTLSQPKLDFWQRDRNIAKLVARNRVGR